MKTARIVVLGVAVLAGVGAFMMMGRSKPPAPVIVKAAPPPPQIPTEQVLVASHDIGLGSLVNEPDLSWMEWPARSIGDGMIVKSREPNAIEDVKGSVTRSQFFRGEPIRRTKIVKGPNAGFMSAILPSGQRAVAINIDTQGATSAGGFILPNDRVDIIRTSRAPGGAGATGDYISETIMRNVRVLAIGQKVEEKNGERVVVGSNATLELTPRQAEQIVLAQRVGQLSLVLRSMYDSGKSDADIPPDDANDTGMTIIRFGVPSPVARVN